MTYCMRAAAATQPPLATAAQPAANLAANDAGRDRVVVIGLTGRAGSGKDAAADYLCEHYGFARLAFADSLKRMLEPLLTETGHDYAALYEPQLKQVALPGLMLLTPRELMQRLGDWGRAIDPQWWVQILLRSAGLADGGAPIHDRILVTDVRYPEEVAALRECGGRILRIERDQVAPLPGMLARHSSEQVAHLPADIVLRNDGYTLDTLHHALAGVMDDLQLLQAEPVEHEYIRQALRGASAPHLVAEQDC